MPILQQRLKNVIVCNQSDRLCSINQTSAMIVILFVYIICIINYASDNPGA